MLSCLFHESVNVNEALNCYKQVENSLEFSAKYNLEVLDELNKKGRPNNKTTIVRWLQLAADHGYTSAQFYL